MTVALIINGIVEWSVDTSDITALAEMYPEYELVEYTGTIVDGYRWDGSNFIEPEYVPGKVYYRITQLAFLNRFTDAEAVAIDLTSQGSTQSAALMRRMQKKIDAAKYIDLSDPNTIQGVGILEQIGLLASGRASEILSTNILPHEAY